MTTTVKKDKMCKKMQLEQPVSTLSEYSQEVSQIGQ